MHSLKTKGIQIQQATPVIEIDWDSEVIAYYSEIETRYIWASYNGELKFFAIDEEVFNEILKYIDK